MTTLDVDCNPDADSRNDKANTLVENYSAGGVGAGHNYKLSHDGQKLITWGPTGIEIVKGEDERIPVDGAIYSYELIWDPDSRYFAFMSSEPEGESVVIVDTQSEPARREVVYSSPVPGYLRGIEWSPWGRDIYFLEIGFNDDGQVYYLKRVNTQSKSVELLVESADSIDFFMPPVTWFEYGQGSQKGRNYSVVYGTRRGLFILPRNSKKPVCLTQAPAVFCRNLEWAPDGQRVVMFFSRNVSSLNGTLSGVVLAHLEETNPEKRLETLSESLDIHTLWYSPKGSFITWANTGGVYFRDPKKIGEEGTRIPNPVIEDEEGNKVEITDKPIKGCLWNDDETRLAITAGNQLWVYDVATKTTELYHEYGDGLTHFIAEPRWRGDRIILTVYEDIRLTGKEPPRTEEPPPSAVPEGMTPEELYKRKQEWIAKEREKFAAAQKAETEAKEKAAQEAKEKLLKELEKDKKKRDGKD